MSKNHLLWQCPSCFSLSISNLNVNDAQGYGPSYYCRGCGNHQSSILKTPQKSLKFNLKLRIDEDYYKSLLVVKSVPFKGFNIKDYIAIEDSNGIKYQIKLNNKSGLQTLLYLDAKTFRSCECQIQRFGLPTRNDIKVQRLVIKKVL